MKKLLCGIMSVLTLFAAGCGKTGNNGESGKPTPPIYNYQVEDKTMNSFFDVSAIQAMTPATELVADFGDVKGYLIDGMPYNGTLVNRAFFWIGKPKGEMPAGGWPAVLLIHGGGGNAFDDWVRHWTKQGYVALALDMNGQMYDDNYHLTPNKEFYHTGSWGSIGCGTTEAEFKTSWTYMNVCNLMLCHNYLRGLDYVNPDKTVATGISWGAYLTCILSGLDKRFQAFAPVYGCGSLFTDSWALHEQGMENLPESYREEWAKVYDPTAYLPYATKPMLFTSGMTDHAFSAVSHKKSTSLIPGKVFYAYTPALAHGHYFAQTPSVEYFFDHILNGTQPLVNFLSASHENGTITVETEKEVPNAAIAVTYSTEADSHLWRWENVEITLQAGVNEVQVPEGATAAVVVGYSDENSYYSASTDLFLFKDVNSVY